MIELVVLMSVTFTLSPVLLGVLAWAFHSPRFAENRISRGAGMQVARANRMRSMSTTSVLSLATVLGVTFLGYDHLISERDVPWWVMVLEGAGILVLYDFVYYFLHRGMHHPRILKAVHGIHHRARNPSSLESLYQHPLELLAGLALLFTSTWIVGPVHPRAFAAAFFVYSMLNILVHSGLDSKTWLLRPIDFLTRKHHVHHHDDPDRNFSSLTPLPDLLFGTAG
jgi:sterol desaturase/sphingolipid hydroxylase (fatty acid hydroxylase superfamily)